MHLADRVRVRVIHPRLKETHMRPIDSSLSLCTTMLLGSASFAQVPQLGPPAWFPGDLAFGAAAGEQTAVRVAAGGQGFLAVWSDTRSTLSSGESTTDVDVYAMRLDPLGAPIDATPIPVTTRYGYQRNPQVAWNGENWLVVWESQDPAFSYYADHLRGARISPAGIVLDPQSVAIRPSISSSSIWSMCANGSQWVVAAEGTSGGDNDLVGIRVAANGTLVSPTPVVLQPAEYFLHFNIHLASAQGEVLLAWSGASTPVARRFDSSLAPIGPVFTTATTNIASNGASYYATWYGGSSQVVGSPIATDGTPQFPAGIPIFSSFGSTALTDASWDGSQWWACGLHATQGVIGARIAPSGTVLDVGGVTVQSPAGSTISSPRVSGGLSGGAQFAWSSFGSGSAFSSNEVYGRHASAAFGLEPAALVSTARPAQLRPAVCAGPDGFAVVFESALGSTRRVLVERFDVMGQALDAEPILAGTTPSAGAGIAWNGSVYCLAWNDGTGVVARRMSANGTFLDPAPIPVMSGASADVDAVGSVFLIVTTESTSFSPEFRSTFVRRFDGATGSFLDAGAVNIGGGYSQLARVAAVGGRWLVTYQTNDSHDSPQASIIATFVNSDGTLGVSTGVGYPGGSPDVADGDGAALLVWRSLSPANANNDVVCRRVSTDGILGPTVTISAAPGRQMNPKVTWDGTQWLVAWEDQRNQVTFYDRRTDVYGARISAGGALLDPASFLWRDSEQSVSWPTLATNGARTLLVTSEMRPEAPYAATRLAAVRTLGDCASPARFCRADTNSSGLAARIDSSGSSSLSANNLVLSASNLPANAVGLFFQGTRTAQPATPFGNGLRCVSGAVRRLEIVQASGGVVAAPQDFSSPVWSGVAANDVRYVQFWFRDPLAGGANFDSSDALELTFCP